MSWRVLGLGALVLWVISMGVIVALFVQGHTKAWNRRTNGNRAGPGGRDMVLAEMRHLLKAVHGVLTALSGQDQRFKAAEGAARAAGMQMAADINPTIMLKLPLAF